MMIRLLGITIIMAALISAQDAFARGAVNAVFNLPTCETYGTGIAQLDVGHRYFDPMIHTTNINIALGYGITDWIDITIARSFLNLDLVGTVKITPLKDFSTDPDIISVSFIGGYGYKQNPENIIRGEDQPSYFAQAVIEKNLFGNRLSIGAVPTFADNTSFYNFDSRYDQSAGCGFFTQIYLFERISLCGDVTMNIYGFAFKYMNYNAGLKYAGYRHTFSLWAGNSAGYSPVEYCTGSETLKPKVSFAFTREFDVL